MAKFCPRWCGAWSSVVEETDFVISVYKCLPSWFVIKISWPLQWHVPFGQEDGPIEVVLWVECFKTVYVIQPHQRLDPKSSSSVINGIFCWRNLIIDSITLFYLLTNHEHMTCMLHCLCCFSSHVHVWTLLITSWIYYGYECILGHN